MLSRQEIYEIVYEVPLPELKVRTDYVQYVYSSEICEITSRLTKSLYMIPIFREEVEKRFCVSSTDTQVIILALAINCFCSLQGVSYATQRERDVCVNILFRAQRCSEAPPWCLRRTF